MNDAPQLILHVGAPKCGSTALQNALSMTPDMVDRDGRALRYTAWRQIGTFGGTLYGREVSLTAQASAYGYVSWPNFRADDPAPALFAGLDRVRRKGLRKGHIPIASCEGWISRADAFSPHLARWGHPPVEVVAFLRPVIEWSNSAFWQWGIWNVLSLDAWLNRGNISYSFGGDLEAWARIPNVRVRFAWAQPDAVAQFRQWYGVDLPPALTRNTSSSPALVGVLKRHQRLRPNGHEADTEFVVQRWCPPVGGRRLWSVTARHIDVLRPVRQKNLAALRRIAADDAMRAVCEDPRWHEDTRHQAEILEGVSPMNNPVQLAGLHASLAVGLERLAVATGGTPSAVPDCPAPTASVKEWDAVLVGMLDTVLAQDKALRDGVLRNRSLLSREGIAVLRLRAARLLAHAQDYWFSNSR